MSAAHEDRTNPPGGPEGSQPIRRRLLQWLAGGLGLAASCAAGIPIVGFLFGPVLQPEPDVWVDLGPLEQFADGQTQLATFLRPNRRPWDGEVARAAAYVRRRGPDIQVFSVHCAHLGCPVTWFPQSGLFMCPCHGGVYYENGERAAGPPPRGLFQYRHRVEQGRLAILAGHVPMLEDPLS